MPESNVIRNTWSSNDLVAYANERGGELLTHEYTGTRGVYTWQCDKGHQWDSTWGNVLKGRWCPECARGKDIWLAKMQAIAALNGGRCLSTCYIDSRTKIRWECRLGHSWEAKPNNIGNGRWCPQCALIESSIRQRRTIENLKQHAASLGGECLDSELITPTAKIRWRCACGHEWSATPQSVMGAKSWCPKCGDERTAASKRPLGRLDLLKKIAIERGGECLALDYKSTNRPIRWKCGNGHEWAASPSDIMRGRWCPQCAARLGERICREYFEQMFQATFPKAKPKWLRGSKGALLELDGYSEALGLAFEHQGVYHYQVEKRFSRTDAELLNRQQADQLKRVLCKQHGVVLVEVPEVPTMTSLEDLPQLIEGECRKQGRLLPIVAKEASIDLIKAYLPTPVYQDLFEIAKQRGGKLLDTAFKGWNVALRWQCVEGHQWSAVPGSVKFQETWCPKCAGVTKKTLGDMQTLAARRGGACLSAEYQNARANLLWRCSLGHEWLATPTSISSRKSWCPYCAGQKGAHLSIEGMKESARLRGGECLSSGYKNSKTKLRWRCAQGHEWDAIPLNVINKKSWCPTCAKQGNTNLTT